MIRPSMAHGSDTDGLPQSPIRPTRRQVRQACDACRVRKVRCATSGEVPVSGCRRCVTLKLPCTFLLPVRPRGPQKGSSSINRKVSVKDRGTSRVSEHDSPISHTSQHDASSPSTRSSVPVRSRDGTLAVEVCKTMRGPPFGQVLPITPGATQQANSNYAISQTLSPHQLVPCVYPTDSLCDRSLFKAMLGDYLRYLYPSIPVVHRPSFRRDALQDRDMFDNNFLGLTIAICAVLVATMPRKFKEYRSCLTPLRFQTRTEMVHYCRELVLGLQGPAYYDEISLNKWAVPYLLAIACFHVGQHNRGRMLEVESMQLARLLELHNISSHVGLNSIEVQLRKRAFWLMFYTYVHSQLTSLRKEKLTFIDATILKAINLHELMPIEVDDELILEDRILYQPQGEVSLATAFNLHSLTFWAAITSTSTSRNDRPASKEHCACTLYTSTDLHIAHLTERLQDTKNILDGIPRQLRQWGARIKNNLPNHLNSAEQEEQRVKEEQLESLRADLHVTHLWLQSIIFERIEALKQSSVAGSSSTSAAVWNEREHICRQMLHLLNNISNEHLEPNGNHLTHKIRDVAGTLLGSPFETIDNVPTRAKEYLQEFADILSRLDGSDSMTTLSLQTWVDSDRGGRAEIT